MTITFIGHGYVGLVTATVFADLGNTVYVIGHTAEKVENLKKGILPIYEPGLEEMVKRNVDAGRLLFTLDYDPAIKNSSVVFIAVGTPPLPTGAADLSVVFAVAEKIGQHLGEYAVVITKSTVPVGTNEKVREIVSKHMPDGSSFDIASVPEFLREGQAIGDTQHPDRIVIGVDSERAQQLLTELHEPIDGELIITNIPSAEMIKYASNAFLATKISFANAIAQLSEVTGADGPQVLRAAGLDSRIGSKFLYAGVGYGGSCFPKDVKAIIKIAEQHGYDFKLLKDVEEINTQARRAVVSKAITMLGGEVKGKTIGVLGLAFKPDTDDMRDAPSRTIIPELLKAGAVVKAFDPIAEENAKQLPELEGTNFVTSAEEVYKNADLIIVLTEWNEFKEMDLEKMAREVKQKNILDGRNIYDPDHVKQLGFHYVGIGR